MQKVIINLAPNISVEVASDNIKQIIEQASFWSSLPSVCPLCQAPLVFFHRLTQSDDSYWGQACTGATTHEANFGVYKKEERGFYYKGEWTKAYDAYQTNYPGPREEGNQPEQQPGQQNGQAPAPAGAAPTANPMAQSLGDMVTAKQLGMIRAIAREAKVDADKECAILMHCSVDELSKRAASDLIERLQDMQRRNAAPMRRVEEQAHVMPPQNVAPNPPPPTPGPTPPPPPAPARPAPVGAAQHGAQCQCSDCDIPF